MQKRIVLAILAVVGMSAWAQTGGGAASTPNLTAQIVAGGRLHGVVRSGSIPLPGVAVTAQNSLTGKKYSTTTDINGAWSLTIPLNGRYVVRTQFAAFAVGSQEALLNDENHDKVMDFSLILSSRVETQEQKEEQQQARTIGANALQAIQQLAANGTQSLSLMSAMSGDIEMQGGVADRGVGTGATLPSIAGNSDFGGDSVAISGQAGAVSPLAGMDMDRIRDAVETYRAQNGGQLGGILGNAMSGGGGDFAVMFAGGPSGGFGGNGGGFGGGRGGGGGGRMNFRGFNPGQPHGAVFWMGSNSALNAQPFALQGQSQEQLSSGTNRIGITFMSSPYLPELTKPSGKDMVFFTLSGSRSSSPMDSYATVPTDAERAGDFSTAGLPAIYDPQTQTAFAGNVIPTGRISSQATNLLTCPAGSAAGCKPFIPEPNLPGSTLNYHLLTTTQSNSSQIGARYMRSLGKNAALPGGGGRGGFGGGRRNFNQGLRQSINFNYNWGGAASDIVNLNPTLGGKSTSNSNSLQAGYTVGYHKVTSIFNANWNRSNAQVTNYFTGQTDIASAVGISGPGGTALNASSLNYGLPNVQMSNFQGISQTQPNLSISQTIAVSEVLSWIHSKHNMRFGGDYRRVHRDFLGGSNATGSFVFTGLFTENASQDASTGSALADMLLGLPQQSSINASATKSYLRDNAMDVYAQDDWRATSSLTLNYGLRYEYYAPYTEKFNHLGFVLTNPDGGFTLQSAALAGVTPGLPDSLVFPYRTALAPRVGLAVRLPKQIVVRAGFGINYSVGQYATFATSMAHQPPFVNQQTNQAALGNTASSACARTVPQSCFTLENGFQSPATIGNYAINSHYHLPYVEAWNLDIQKTLPWGIVMNAGYNGSKGNHQDMRLAPRAVPGSPLTDPTALTFTYGQAAAFYKMSAGTLRVNKRMTHGVSMGANYQYMHAIDNAASINGGTATVVAQNWQDPDAETGNSSLDVRHKVSGTYLFELPFGKDKRWATAGTGSHILEGFSVSGSFTFATGMPLSPSYSSVVSTVTCGTGGAMRPDLVPGVSVTAGGGSLHRWFNPGAYAAPTATPGYCNYFGNAARNSIEGPGVLQNNMSLSKTMQLGDTHSLEIRAMINNVFNTVQYSGVNTNVTSPEFGWVTSVGAMRSFQFTSRFRF